MIRRPRIGITMRLEQETGRFYLCRDYSERVEAAGGVPVHISLIPKRDYIVEVMSQLDGVLLPGSNTDIDPVYYGEEPHSGLRTVIPVKDETEMLVLAEAERLKLPILAICYGMQALNVFRAGKLVQDIGSVVKSCIKHDQGMPVTRASHSIKVAKPGILAGLSAVKNSKGPIRVNTSHHQAVAKVGKGLKATAWAKDGVIECIESTGRGNWVLGVQWHPELLSDSLSDEIFAVFVSKCRN
ncbi:MAG: gamma-glutamyl-gamma-aminobutyrate hydrolase family protein [Pyrinomonadaceae bacterium]